MWDTLRAADRKRSAYLASTVDLYESTSRRLIYTMAVLYALAHLALTIYWPASMERMWVVLLCLAPTFALAVILLPRHFALAHLTWQAGTVVAVTLAGYLFQQPLVAFLYALLPLISTATLGRTAGFVAEGVVFLLLLTVWASPIMPYLPITYRAAILAGGLLAAIFTEAVIHPLLTTSDWLSGTLAEAQRQLDELLGQRVELAQAQEDLIHANHELARMSERLRALHIVAEEARRAKEEFVANVSHELRTPLNMIIGFTETMSQSPRVYGATLPPALRADLSVIQRNSQHLAKLVDDVLDLSQIEAGRMALSREWTAIADVLQAAVVAVKPLYESKRLYLDLDLPGDLPPVFCDSTRVRQVVINLLSNAARFTEQGGVTVKAQHKEESVMITVTDSGPGIAPDRQERLFQPFEQLDSSIRRSHGGSGLGLSISKHFVELHGGTMTVESEVGVSTSFRFTLPLQPPLADDGAVLPASRRWINPYQQHETRSRPARSTVAHLSPRYVVLDSDDVLVRVLSRYRDRAEVVLVREIEEALDELGRAPAQALVVNTPSLDENDPLFGRLADLPYGTPAVVCWAPGRGGAAKRLGATGYLMKPIDRTILLATLEGFGASVQTILLVDDEPDALQLLTRMIAASGRSYRLLRATDGEQALEMLRQRRPDLMLIDLLMPGKDGFQVLEEKRRDPAIYGIPSVVISSRDPNRAPIVTGSMTVVRGEGLSALDLLGCIQAISEVLLPVERIERPVQPETPPA